MKWHVIESFYTKDGERMNYSKRGTDLRWKKKLIFSGVFIQESLLHTIMSRKFDINTKQWLLLVISRGFPTAPDLSTLARTMGCTRQNVKKLTQGLVEQGYIKLEKSNTDARSSCVVLLPRGEAFCEKCESMEESVQDILFKDFTDEEIEMFYRLNGKFNLGLNRLDMESSKNEDDK